MSIPLLAATAPSGPARGPLLVLGPSLGTSTIVWDPAVALLRGSFRTISWDLPGHGLSPATRTPFTVAELADGVIRVLDELDEPRALIGGVSLGGAVGLELLLRYPDRITAAAILCSGAIIGSAAGWRERAETARTTGTSSLVVPSAQRWFAPDSINRSPEITGQLLHSLRDADDESYALCCEALAVYDVRAALPRIEAPVLAMWGEHDTVTPESSAAEIATGVANGRLACVMDAGHLAPAEQPSTVARLMTEFFEENK
jgi:3-oxoadipate enol-lactonase